MRHSSTVGAVILPFLLLSWHIGVWPVTASDPEWASLSFRSNDDTPAGDESPY